ncbi:membrane-associated phospholipid phosphatase [Hamadaea flava]|uniref:Phosphatase PAP2 family protein n=1 Tax=Hamadaea flava TaxID=1742688 RepID=A0ABV8LIF8_9ACTN|nr:phosphatase PAP2 family protein [Hamadaea flava]MCP2324288.1 membrane-associated phospholipid phosphatase [Hamadaea flava]
MSEETTAWPLRRILAAVVEFGGLALWLWLFAWLHTSAGKDAVAAMAHASSLQGLERALGLDVELWANRWLVEYPGFAAPAVVFYRSYYLVVLGVLVWAYLRHSEVYRHVRRAAVAMTVLVLPMFWLLPMAPPRLALPGIVDVIAETDPFWGAETRDPGSGQNHFSAMPSMHVAWSLWCAYAVWAAVRVRHPRWALLAWVFPLLMIVVVLTTGNHYLLDVVGSVALVACSVGVARLADHFTARTA